MAKILDEGFERPAEESVLVQSDTLTADEPAFAPAVDDVVERVSAVPAVTNLATRSSRRTRDQVSADGHSAMVTFDIRGRSLRRRRTESIRSSPPSTRRRRRIRSSSSAHFGAATAEKEITERSATTSSGRGSCPFPSRSRS